MPSDVSERQAGTAREGTQPWIGLIGRQAPPCAANLQSGNPSSVLLENQVRARLERISDDAVQRALPFSRLLRSRRRLRMNTTAPSATFAQNGGDRPARSSRPRCRQPPQPRSPASSSPFELQRRGPETERHRRKSGEASGWAAQNAAMPCSDAMICGRGRGRCRTRRVDAEDAAMDPLRIHGGDGCAATDLRAATSSAPRLPGPLATCRSLAQCA
jgi:hypothetical protein